jgi:hypothetical protein
MYYGLQMTPLRGVLSTDPVRRLVPPLDLLSAFLGEDEY